MERVLAMKLVVEPAPHAIYGGAGYPAVTGQLLIDIPL
jgi:hypothetical protein